MAIIIPSAKTYNRQNPKIRDNVIERIEVGAVEVVHDNEYETTVFNQAFLSGWKNEQEISKITQGQKNVDQIGTSYFFWYRAVSYISLLPTYLPVTITIPKLKNNKYINKLYRSYKENETTKEKVADIKITVYADKYQGVATATGHYNFINGANPTIFNISTNYPENPESFSGQLNPLLSYTHDNTNLDVQSTIDYKIKETILNPQFDDTSDKNNFILSFDCFVGYEQVLLGGENNGYYNGTPSSLSGANESDLPLNGTCVKYIPKQVEITVYGDTIGIDLVDKTVYINGETQKKVHSVDGNELMQTSNYIKELNFDISQLETVYTYSSGYTCKVQFKDKTPRNYDVKVIAHNKRTERNNPFYLYKGNVSSNGYSVLSTNEYEIISATATNLPSIEKMYGETQKQYSNGKETAVIRCSIGDYYESYVGDKIIEEDLQNDDKRLSVSGDYLIFTPNYESKVVKVFDFEGESQEEDIQLNAELQDNGTIKFWWEQGRPNNFKSLRFLVELSTEKTLKITTKPFESVSFSRKEEYGYDDNGDQVVKHTITLDKAYPFEIAVEFIVDFGGGQEKIVKIIKSGETQFYEEFDARSDASFEELYPVYVPMVFDLYDEVIPMVYGADGKDKPMSFYKDGTPKVFTVLKVDPYYDGAVWQELTLQEKYKEF